ncbi:hypothetical protein EON64_12395 [archaeon]|nr:MAG: hypothetical protein EON64_12395 [archaeon]
MGCNSSSARSPNDSSSQPKRKKAKKASKDSEAQDMTDQEVHKMREDILQRHDSEVDIIAQISAEREALKVISSVKIERPSSCEDLATLVPQPELQRLCVDGSHFLAQQKARATLLLTALRNKTKPWVVSPLSLAPCLSVLLPLSLPWCYRMIACLSGQRMYYTYTYTTYMYHTQSINNTLNHPPPSPLLYPAVQQPERPVM